MIKGGNPTTKTAVHGTGCWMKISKFNREINCRLRLNLQCNQLRLHVTFCQFNRLWSLKNCNRLRLPHVWWSPSTTQLFEFYLRSAWSQTMFWASWDNAFLNTFLSTQPSELLFFSAETFQWYFAATFWSLRCFCHLSHSCIKTRCNSVH